MTGYNSKLIKAFETNHVPTNDEQETAKRAISEVAQIYQKRNNSPLTVKLEIDGQEKIVNFPESALHLFFNILNNMALGRAVSIIPEKTELTTQEAADFLNISRPFLIGLLNKGDIPFHMTGTHRRILFVDLLKYDKLRKSKYESDMKELTALSKELGLY